MNVSDGMVPIGRSVTDAMALYCAIDIMGGGAVRLVQGDFDRRTQHGDPVELAMQFVGEGARFLHVVDLDAARGGRAVNHQIVLRIVRDAGVPVQVGGGVRTYDDAVSLLDAGVARVIVSTAAVEEPELVDLLVSRYPNQIALGLDHRSSDATDHRSSDATDHRSSAGSGRPEQIVAVRGWEAKSSFTVEALLERFADSPLGAVVVTSIDRDGMLSGPDISGLERILSLSAHPVVASGGVRSASDLTTLAAISVVSGDDEVRRIEGAVVGRALANGSLRVKEALAACARSG
jgi:phosphoribosylformimino-5-aminoimidazole carboxamide ribotide isomerase